MEYPMIHMFAFENETKPVDENLTKQELLEVINHLIAERPKVDDLIAGKTTFFDLVRRQQKRAESLNNVTPISTPFLDLVS